jgi:peroxiredoxin
MSYLNLPSGEQLYFEDYGNGPAVILIHGWPLSSAMWEYQVSKLLEKGHRVISYDRRGFGKSNRPLTGYDYPQLATDLHQLITHLKLDKVSLVGFSMGGGELAQYVHDYGENKIEKLVFLSSIAPFLLQTDDNPNGAPDQVFKGMEEQIKTRRADFLYDFGRAFLNVDGLPDRISEGQVQYNFHIAASASPKGTLDCINSFGRTDLREALKRITVPTLFIHGGDDAIVPIAPSSQQGHEIVKHSRLEIIPDAPHGLYVTHKEEVNQLLINFL